ncbi:hypothetical protein Tco_1231492, partial [Tanacetum coccineum]
FYATQNYLKVLKYNWEKIPFELQGEASEPERRSESQAISKSPAGVLRALNATLPLEELVRDSIRKTYGGKPSVDLLRSFLNLGYAGDWLTPSSRGGADVPKGLTKPVSHLEN